MAKKWLRKDHKKPFNSPKKVAGFLIIPLLLFGVLSLPYFLRLADISTESSADQEILLEENDTPDIIDSEMPPEEVSPAPLFEDGEADPIPVEDPVPTENPIPVEDVEPLPDQPDDTTDTQTTISEIPTESLIAPLDENEGGILEGETDAQTLIGENETGQVTVILEDEFIEETPIDTPLEAEFVPEPIEVVEDLNEEDAILTGELILNSSQAGEILEESTITLADVQIENKTEGDSVTLNEALVALVAIKTSEKDIERAVLQSVLKENNQTIAQEILADQSMADSIQEKAEKGLFQSLENKVTDVIGSDETQKNLATSLEDDPQIEEVLENMITEEVKKEILEESVSESLQTEGPIGDLPSVVTRVIEKDYNKFILKELISDKLVQQEESRTLIETAVGMDESKQEDNSISPVMKITARGPGGTIDIPLDKVRFRAGSLIMAVEPIRQFKPGLYQLEVEINNPVTNQQEVILQDFAWGVLAMNTNQDRYNEGDKAMIHVGVLDDNGVPVCDADVSLAIQAPNGSTAYPHVENTGLCETFDSMNTLPDYQIEYTFGQTGSYELNLVATLPDGASRTSTSFVDVQPSADFLVTRYAATRLYPVGESPMTIDVSFPKDFTGYITDIVPIDFQVRVPEDSSFPMPEIRTPEGGETKLISWQVQALAGEIKRFYYLYDAPDISPEFYTVGPLSGGGGFEEMRRWQIANDEPVIAADTGTALRGQWEFNTGSGSTAFDTSTFANNGTLTNLEADDWSTDRPTTSNDNSYALELDGGEYVIITDPAGGELDFGDTADLTVTGWFKWESPQADNDVLVAKRSTQSAAGLGYMVYMDFSDSKLVFEVSDGVDEYQIKSSSAFTTGAWTHFAAVFDQDNATNSTMYINGVENTPTKTGTIGNVGSLSNILNLVIGAESDAQFSFFGGLDDIRVYNRVLTSAEIAVLAGGNKPGGVSGADLWLRADNGTDTTTDEATVSSWVDYSGSANNGTASGTPAYQNDSAKLINFHPVVEFASTDRFDLATSIAADTSTMFVVGRPTVTTAQRVLFHSDAGALHPFLINLNTDNVGYSDTTFRDSNLDWSTNEIAVFRSVINANASPGNFYKNASSVSSTVNLTNTNSFYNNLGNEAAASKPFGDVAEVIVFDANTLTSTEAKKIESYLALKYGITLDQTSSNDYLASNCTDGTCATGTIFWSASTAGTFKNNIAGIARDDSSNLNQTSSRSSQNNAIITMSGATSLDDFDSLVWSNNAGLNTWSSTGAPAGYKLLSRRWIAQEKGDVGNVEVEFNTENPYLPMPELLSGSSYYLIYDSDNDNSLSDETPVLLYDDATNGDDTTSDEKWTTTLNFPTGGTDGAIEFTLATATVANDQIYPGGVSSSLNLWLRANNGVTNTGNATDATQWASEIYGHKFNHAELSSSTFPTYHSTTASKLINYNPVLAFDATTDRLGVGPNTLQTMPSSDMFVSVVYSRPDTTVSEKLLQYSAFDVTGGSVNEMTMTVESDATVDSWLDGNLLSSADVSSDNGLPHIMNTARTGSTHSIIFDGQFRTSEAEPDALLAGGCLVLGAGSSSDQCAAFVTTENFEGDMAEAIFYAAYPTALQQLQINSYLALKYGITLSSNTDGDGTSQEVISGVVAEGDYVASDGSTIVFDISDNGTYTNDIAGIGRDDTSGLNQTQSKSSNPDAIVRMANAASQDNLDFVTWGNDDGDNLWSSTEGPTGYRLLGRQWRAQETGDLGVVDIEFDTEDIHLPLPELVAGTSYYFVSDTDNDGSLTDETPVQMYDNGTNGDDTAGDERWTAQLNFPVADTAVDFGIATQTATLKYPGGVGTNLNLWLKANGNVTQTGNATNATAWSSEIYGTTFNHSELASSTFPTYYTNRINNNPALDWDQTTDRLGVGPNAFATIPSTDMFVSVVYSRADTTVSEDLLQYSTFDVTGGTANEMVMTVESDATVDSWLDGNALSTTAVSSDNGLAHIMNTARTGSTHSIIFDGQFRTSEAEPDALLIGGCLVLGAGSTGDQCAGFVANDNFEGDMAEAIFYAGYPTALQQLQINSYLALKYGVTLSSNTDGDGTSQEVISGAITEGDYVASNGTTAFFDISTGGTYVNDIAGIGQDDASALDQLKSKSQNSDALVQVSDATSQDNLDFLTWANNDGAATWTSTGAPTGYQILTRQWQAQETGEIGTVDVEIDVADADLDVPAPVSGSTYYFVYDLDDDGSLSDETPVAMVDNGTGGDDTASDNKWTAQLNFPAAVIDGKMNFTIATSLAILPTVTDANISIAGGTGTGGAYIVGNTLTITWNNSAAGDNNSGITSVTADLSGWGGAMLATMTDTTTCGGVAGNNIYEACYTLVSGAIDRTSINASVTATSAGGSTTTSDTTNATVDNEAPNISNNGTLVISTDNGTAGVAALNNGVSNQDKVTQSAVTLAVSDTDTSAIDLTALTGQAALALGVESGVLTSGILDSATQTFTITVTDNAGNVTTTLSDSISVDNRPPIVTTPNISVTGATGTAAAFKSGDSATGEWNNTAVGDNNNDITSVNFALSNFRSTDASVVATNVANVWSASITGALDSQGDTNNNTTVTVIDDAGNTVTTVGTNNYTVDTIIPVISSITSVAGDTAATYYDTTNDSSTAIIFVSSDTGVGLSACRWSTSDVAFSSMANTCASTTNCTTTLSGQGAKTVYLACIDGAGNTTGSNTQVDYTIDSVAPSGTSITPVSTRIIDTSHPSFTVDDGTEATSGINTSTRLLERRDAIYSGNSCDTFGAYTPVTYSGTYPTISDATVSGSNCYQYRWSVSDNAGNTTTSSATATIVRVPLDTITITGGNNQSYGDGTDNPIGHTFATALQVRITDGGTNTALVDEVTVDFAMTSVPGTPTATGQSLSASSDNTDASGYAEVSLTLGDRAGNYEVEASSSDAAIGSSTVTFTATAGQHFSLVIPEAALTIPLDPISNPTDFASPTLSVTTNAASYEVHLTPDQWPTFGLNTILNWVTSLGFGWNLNTGTVTAFAENLGLPATTTAYTCSGDSCQGTNNIDIDLHAGIDFNYPPGSYTNNVEFSGQNIGY